MLTEVLAGLMAIIIEALLKVFTSQYFMKLIMATMVYVFLFAVIPALIVFLVPQPIMNGVGSYYQMLQGGMAQLVCSGSQTVSSGNSLPGGGNVVSCNAVITMAQWGAGVAYILDWFQVSACLGVLLPVLAVSFLFKRI